MYKYIWDTETGGLLLISEQSKFSKEPRPVYSRELDALGFNNYWTYPKTDSAPIMWAEANNYIYKGKIIAKTKGGSFYTKPQIEILMEPENDGEQLECVNIERMCEKNRDLLETLVQETIQNIYNIYIQYKGKVDVFYVAFSGGKDSVAILDLVQRTLPHDDFLVIFGDTHMEFPDTYKLVDDVEDVCASKGIRFFRTQSHLQPLQTWGVFGPPSTSNRWCCSVHKTSPQINLLREITGKYDFTGIAFTGVRGDESVTRSTYDSFSNGKKHSGQYSYHGILNWSSAELFLYIYDRKLIINDAYLKGISRVGCLVCPNSTGRNDYMKRQSYTDHVDEYIDIIASTSSKTNYSPKEMQEYIDAGFWRTRRSGKALNFGQDLFEVNFKSTPPTIAVYQENLEWLDWAKTIGEIAKFSETTYGINFREKLYRVKVEKDKEGMIFKFLNTENSKNDIKFLSLFRSVIIKSIYCVACGACEAECKHNCIKTEGKLHIGDNCVHCYKCHDIHDHCLRYGSIKNIISEGTTMTGKKLNGYDGHGPRAEWLASYIKYNGSEEFWNTDGDGLVANKKKEKFRDFLRDAGIIAYDRNAMGDKFTKYKPTRFSDVVVKYGAYSDITWALILSNLVYTPDYNWYVKNLIPGEIYTPESIKMLLMDAMPNDASGHGKENMINALKIALCKTPLGTSGIFAKYDIDVKLLSNGEEKLSLNSLWRSTWENPDPRVILYSLYKFAQACEGYFQFSLNVIMDKEGDREGVSPANIFGVNRDNMIRILNGLSINYPEFLSASFTLDLNSITLQSDKTAEDVLGLF